MRYIILLIVLIFMANISIACEFGTTYKDFCLGGDEGYPTEKDYKAARLADGYFFYPIDDGYDYYYYFDKHYFNSLHLDSDLTPKGIPIKKRFLKERIEIYTGYTWCGNENPPPKDECPYVLYKSHRWYPQYHGIIYVYKDGREVK